MNRRHFLQATGTAALALSAFPQYAAEFADAKKRVGLIGKKDSGIAQGQADAEQACRTLA